jgi:hypothetical protein
MPTPYLTARQVAAGVGVTRQAVEAACRKGSLVGARKFGDGPKAPWLIPARYADPAVYRAAVGRAGRKRRAV